MSKELKESKNVVVVEGLLQELDLTEGNDKNNRPYIRGKVTIRTEQKVNGNMEVAEVPISVFAYKDKNAGGPNPGYQNIKALENFKRITVDGENAADKVRVTSGRLAENLYAPNGKLIDSWVINASFFNKVNGDMDSKAVFEQTIVIRSIDDEVVNDEPTGRLKVIGIIVKYNGSVDHLTFYVENTQAIAHIRQNWNERDTVNIKGYVRVKPVLKTVVKTDDSMFGEEGIDTESKTRTAKELILAAGSAGCLDEDEAYDFELIREANIERKSRIDAVIEKGVSESKSSAKTSTKKGW